MCKAVCVYIRIDLLPRPAFLSFDGIGFVYNLFKRIGGRNQQQGCSVGIHFLFVTVAGANLGHVFLAPYVTDENLVAPQT